ncbi:MAG: penicillin-binding protein 2 [Betaproteobacteria bacterium HGW-Betaproteobacteria-1]|jgi:penicillin-binding protein 2|nr:MAG: penicillin-binding protein 2 [Betaproteobacteria bacterium HGW-Betaproteobacteria-1]
MRARSELKNYRQESYYFRIRLAVAAAFVLLCFGILAARLFYLQMAKHEHYHTLAENNRISLVPIVPNRGLIFDKNGVVLAHNFFVYTLEITPARVKDVEETINQLSELVEIGTLDRKRFKKILSESQEFESVPLRTHLNEAEAARFAVNRYRFPGVEIKSRLFRHYPQGALGSHMVGYIGRINDKDLINLKESGELSNYKGSDHIGKSGLEEYYESILHGKTGFKQVETDSGGHAVRVLSSTPPVPGDNLILSVDSKLQKIGEDAFGDKRGAMVAIQPKTGEVLAYVSMPTFDSNLFVGGIDTENWKALNESLDKPLINRPLRGIYPPGSTFKPFIALAGLEAGRRAPPFSINDPGFFTLPGNTHRYRDWKPQGHGVVDMRKAITISCDTFFYGLAHEMGIHAMTDFVRHFGFGQRSGIDISGELEGLLPTPEWKKRRWNQPWYPGETVIFGIGQGYMLATPMQLAQATAIFANNGVAMKPHLVTGIQEASSGTIRTVEQVVTDRMELKPENVEIVRKGMEDVTLPGGTAVAVGAGAPYTVAAKTGTAQVVGIKQGEKYDASKLDERHRDHALFIAYAPADDPQIALAIIVENGGSGGSVAGPIARKVMDYYLLGKEPAESTPINPIALPEAAIAPATTEEHAHD